MSIKPKNRVMCPDSMKQKMLFESERKARDFIKWNGDEIDTHGGVLRPYYCPACCGWHITHQRHREEYDTRTERMITAFNKSVRPKKIDRLIHYQESDNLAREIWKDLPAKVKSGTSKSALRYAITEYFDRNCIEDKSGDIRGRIYKIWEERK